MGDVALTVAFSLTVLADLSAMGDVALTVAFSLTMLADLSASAMGDDASTFPSTLQCWRISLPRLGRAHIVER